MKTHIFKKLVFVIATSVSFSVNAEVVNQETQMDPRHIPTYAWRGASELQRQIQSEVDQLLKVREKAKPEDKLDFAYINKKNGRGGFATYLVDLNKGRIIDTFPSLIGYNGLGCGKGQTPPGVQKLTAKTGKGASRKAHWGNDWLYYDMDPVASATPCSDDPQVVVHSNKRLTDKSPGDYISSRSAGCFTVPPDRLDQMKHYAGNAYIFNVP